MTRLIAEQTQPAVAVDGLGTPGANASQPAVAINEYGRGFTTATTDSDNVVATQLTTNATPAGTQQVNTDANTATPYATPGSGRPGLDTDRMAGDPRARPGADRAALRPGRQHARSGDGGLGAVRRPDPGRRRSGHRRRQHRRRRGGVGAGISRGLSIDAVQLFQPPHQPTATQNSSTRATPSRFCPGRRRRLTGGPSRTASPSMSFDRPDSGHLDHGSHRAGRRAPRLAGDGEQSGRPDEHKPVRHRVRGHHTATAAPHAQGEGAGRDTLTARLTYTDPVQPGEPGAQASGIASVSLKWGDGSPSSPSRD